jgi:hypothetical protein
MTTDQRTKLMAYWWPDAARAQGWDKNDRAKRLEVLSQAIGRPLLSAADLNTTTDIDAVKAHLLALSQPANINAQVDIANMPRTRLIKSIEQYIDSRPGYGFHSNYIKAIARNMYGTADWQSLPEPQLTNLRNTIANRARAKKKAVSISSPSNEEEKMDMAETNKGQEVLRDLAADDNLPF